MTIALHEMHSMRHTKEKPNIKMKNYFVMMMKIGRLMKCGTGKVIDDSNEIWPLGGDSGFQFENEIHFPSN